MCLDAAALIGIEFFFKIPLHVPEKNDFALHEFATPSVLLLREKRTSSTTLTEQVPAW
jgi:hypothetical protein